MKNSYIKLFLFAFLLLLMHTLSARSNAPYSSLSTEFLKPDTVISLVINFSDDGNQFQIIDKFSKLQNLWLQEMKTEDVEKIKSLNAPFSLIISDSPDLNLEILFKDGMNLSDLKELSLINNQTNKLPNNISKLNKLNKIVISDNDDFDLNSFFDLCKNFPLLNSMNLSNNSIPSLPSKTPVFINIKTLDISENLLDTLGSFINCFPKLDSLIIHGNMLNNPSNDLKKIKNNKIKYISLDSSVVFDDNWSSLKNQFSQTTFNLISDIPNKNIFTDNYQKLPDSLSFSLKENADTSTNESVTIGVFRLEKNTFQILSDAYLHYPRLFPDANTSFDSLLFEERFSDLRYINNIKKNTSFSRGRIHLGLSKNYFKNIFRSKKKYSKKICYYIDTEPVSIRNNYDEISAYNKGTKWVYKNKDYTRAKFKKKFIGTRNSPVLWHDIKIEYNADNNDYVMILKGDTSFYYLECNINKKETSYSKNKKKLSEAGSLKEEKSNLRKFLKYLKLRKARENKVNKIIIKNKDTYVKSLTKFNYVSWLNFQQMYMSKEERQLTKEQWLEYYEKVIANEPEAIRNSDASIDATKRALDVDSYSQTYSAFLINDSLPIVSRGLLFNDLQNNILAVKKVLMILPDKQKYISLSGTLNSDYLQTIIALNSKIMFVVETISGKIGVATSSDVAKILQDESTFYTIPMQMLDNKIATVGQIYNILKW